MQPTAISAMLALRIVVAGLLFIHGSTRLLTGGVAGFGEFLAESHIPLGPAVAWLITLMEIVGTVVLGFGLTTGILLVHIHSGWFVVGGGRQAE
jgi:putative oxidoreductase